MESLVQGVHPVSDLLAPPQVHRAAYCSPVDQVCRQGQDRLECLVARVRSNQRCLQRWSACGRSWVATESAVSAHKTQAPPNAQRASLGACCCQLGRGGNRSFSAPRKRHCNHTASSRPLCQVGLRKSSGVLPHRLLAGDVQDCPASKQRL